MKQSIFLCLFFVVLAAGLWPNEQPKWMTLLTNLEFERRTLMRSHSSIESELSITRQALLDLKSEYSQMESAFSEQRKLLDERKAALEERKRELEREKALSLEHKAALELRERQLSESVNSLSNLEQNFDDYRKQAESEIEALAAWPVITAIAVPTAILLGALLKSLIDRIK